MVLDPYRIEARAAAFSILVGSGYFTQADAFFICFNPIVESKTQLDRKACDLKRSQPRTITLINDFRNRLAASNVMPSMEEDNNNKEVNKRISEGNDFTSKDSILQVLTDTLAELRGKDRADVAMKIADLMQMKKEVAESDITRISFYLPLQCFRCQLYKEAQSNND